MFRVYLSCQTDSKTEENRLTFVSSVIVSQVSGTVPGTHEPLAKCLVKESGHFPGAVAIQAKATFTSRRTFPFFFVIIISITHSGKKKGLGLTFLSLCLSQEALKLY